MAVSQKLQVLGKELSFLVGDWVLVSGDWVLELTHGLENEKVNVEIWENENAQVMVDRLEIFNTNKIKLYVSASPDCRFTGKAIINRI